MILASHEVVRDRLDDYVKLTWESNICLSIKIYRSCDFIALSAVDQYGLSAYIC